MIIYLLFFFLVEKIFSYDGLKCSFTSLQFEGAISDMDYGAMVDDKTVLISESGNDIILTIIFWKQWPWKPLRYVLVIAMKVSSGYHESVWHILCLKQILLELL